MNRVFIAEQIRKNLLDMGTVTVTVAVTVGGQESVPTRRDPAVPSAAGSHRYVCNHSLAPSHQSLATHERQLR